MGEIKGSLSSSGSIGVSGTVDAYWKRGESAYQLAVKQGYTGTLQEWLDGLKAKSIEMRNNNQVLEWKYENETEWTELIDLSGQTNYDKLLNLPTINGIPLVGDITLDTIGPEDALTNLELEELLN